MAVGKVGAFDIENNKQIARKFCSRAELAGRVIWVGNNPI